MEGWKMSWKMERNRSSPGFCCAQVTSHFTFKISGCVSYNVQHLKLQRLCWERLLNILENRQRICQLGIKITSSRIQICPCILLWSLKHVQMNPLQGVFIHNSNVWEMLYGSTFFPGSFLGIQTIHTVLCKWRHISVEKALGKSVTHALSVDSRIFYRVSKHVYSVRQKGLSNTFFHSFARIIQERSFRYEEMIC